MPNVSVDLPQSVIDYIEALIPSRFANRSHALRHLIEAGIVDDLKARVVDAIGTGHVSGPRGGYVPMMKVPRHLLMAAKRRKRR